MNEFDIVYCDEKKALLDLCLRNAFRFATGQIKFTRDVGFQLDYIMAHANKPTRDLIKDIFAGSGIIE